MRKVIRGQQINVIVIDTGKDWSVNVLHNGTLQDFGRTREGFRVTGGTKKGHKVGIMYGEVEGR